MRASVALLIQEFLRFLLLDRYWVPCMHALALPDRCTVNGTHKNWLGRACASLTGIMSYFLREPKQQVEKRKRDTHLLPTRNR